MGIGATGLEQKQHGGPEEEAGDGAGDLGAFRGELERRPGIAKRQQPVRRSRDHRQERETQQAAFHATLQVAAPHASARAISSADRSVSATKVSVPLVQPAVGSVGAPTTNRFSWSCVRPWLSQTLVAGSVPIRQPPAG